MLKHSIGLAIEAIAKSQGKPTGKDLAAKIGVTYETLRKWRKNLQAPNRDRQQRISEYLDNVPPSQFMFGPDELQSGVALNEAPRAYGGFQLSDQERQLIENLRDLVPTDQQRIADEIADRADSVRAALSYHASRKRHPEMAAAVGSVASATARPRIAGDGNPQQWHLLPVPAVLESSMARDAFSANPSEREKGLHDSIETNFKGLTQSTRKSTS